MAIVATIPGIGGGILVAKAIIAIFNSAGIGFPSDGGSAAHGRRRRPRRCRHHPPLGDRPGPPRQDPARRGDASRARLRSDEPEAARRRRPRHVGRSGDVRARSRPPGRNHRPAGLAGGSGLLIFLGVASISSTGPTGDLLIGWPVAKVLGTTGKPPGRTPAGTAADVGVGRGADDRRGPRQRGRRLRLVAAGHVLGDPRGVRPGRLHHHRRVVPGPAAECPRRWHPAGGLGGHRRAGAVALIDGEQKAIGAADPVAFSNSSTSDSSTAASRGWRTAASWSTGTWRRTSTCEWAIPST